MKTQRGLACLAVSIVGLAAAAGGVVPVLGAPAGEASGATRRGVVPRDLPNGHPAWCVQCDHGAGLEWYDVRVHEPIRRAATTALAEWAAKEAERGVARLKSATPSVTVDFDQLLGTPGFVRSTLGMLTGQRHGVDGVEVAAQWADANVSLLGVGGEEVRGNVRTRDFVTRHNKVRHVTVQQTHDGVEVFGALARFSTTVRGELINFGSTLLPRPVGGFVPPAARLEASEAVVRAAADAGVTVALDELAVQSRREGPDDRVVWKAPAQLRADDPLESRLVYFPLDRHTVVPAWLVTVPVRGLGHTYDTVIDATDGHVLHRTNRLVCAQDITFRVFTDDSPAPLSPSLATPSTFQPPVQERSLVTVTAAQQTAASPLGWIPDGVSETFGNNVQAHTDLDGDNVADTPRPQAGPGMVFDPPLDLALAPADSAAAGVVQMFYLSNVFHDRLHGLGFDEPAGNFQSDNFGRGGTGNDPIRADVQDGGGTNNANFSSGGSDGSGARVQMYVWTNPTPDRDGAFESDIVFHELAHGVSIRLHGGLSGVQPPGMGEGWSDFIGIALNAKPGDDPDGNYVTGPWATRQLGGVLTQSYYFGIRRFPYSTDMSKGPLTFGDIDTSTYDVPGSVPRSPADTTNNGVHDRGEVWCQMLMECRANLMRAHGFAGNEQMLQLVIDGMKLAPGNPTFIQSRDAILQADLVNNAGANASLLWAGFARRGIGFAATGPASSESAGVVEDFSTPIFASFSFPDGLPSSLSPSGPTSFRVSVTGSGLTLNDNSGTLSYRTGGGSFATVPMAWLGGGDYRATIPPAACLSTVEYYVSVGTDQGVRSSPTDAPTSVLASQVFTGAAPLVTESFETESGWTVGPDTATAGGWVRVDPVGTAAQPEDDATPGAGTQCFVTGQGAVGGALGAADVDGGRTVLTSPVYDLSGAADAVVSYKRWYSNGAGAGPYADVFTVEFSTNGGATWVAAETVGPANSPDTNPGWRDASWTLSSRGAVPGAGFRVRFIAEDAGAGSLIEAAVDDFAITAVLCQSGPAQCGLADVGGQGGLAGFDGQLDNNDFVVFIDYFFVLDARADLGVQGGQAGSDGQFDNNDFVAFIDAFFAGCSG